MLTAGLMIALLQAAAPTVQSSAAPTGMQPADANKVICKRIPRTGSIVAKEKVCLTRVEWQRQSETARGIATEIQDASNR